MLASTRRGVWTQAIAWAPAGLVATLLPSTAWADDYVFQFDSLVDIGADVQGDNDWHWDAFLGLDIDTQLKLGGIAGKKNQTVIPAIDFGFYTTPAVKADTRTGLKITGDLDARAGLELFADFDAGGLASNAAFSFAPTLTVPDGFASGEFFKLSTGNVVASSTFDQYQIDLPSLTMGADAVLELDMNVNVEAAAPVVLPYRKYTYGPDPVNERVRVFETTFDMETDESGQGSFANIQFLPGFDVDLPDFSLDVIPGVDPADPVYSKQISVEPKSYVDKKTGETVQPKAGFNIDIGEIQLFKPIRNETLFVETSVAGNQIHYSADTNIFSFGLDIDGIISAALAGQSFTEFEMESKVASLRAELLDFKYGPEFGYKQEQTVTPELGVTLSFNAPVLMKQANGETQIVETYTGNWEDLPEFSLLTDDQVDVTVQFGEYEAILSQRGAVTLGDYWEFSALELEGELKLGIPGVKSTVNAGPVVHERGAGLSSALGEVEFEIFNETRSLGTFDLSDHVADQSFSLTPVQSAKLYLANGDVGVGNLNAWRALSGDGLPTGTANDAVTDLSGRNLVIGRKVAIDGQMVLQGTTFNDQGQQLVANVPAVLQRDRDGKVTRTGTQAVTGGNADHVVRASGLTILKGSNYVQQGARGWEVANVRNDGLYDSSGYTHFHASDRSLSFTGDGTVAFNGVGELEADILVNGEGHTLSFGSNPQVTVFQNRSALDDPLFYSRFHDAQWPQPSYTSEKRHLSEGLVQLDYKTSFLHSDTLVADAPLPQSFGISGHRFLITDTVRNAGTIQVAGSDLVMDLDRTLINTSTGQILAEQGAVVGIDVGTIDNDGLVQAERSVVRFTRDGKSLQGNGGRFVATGSNARVEFQGRTNVSGQMVFEAKQGGTVHLGDEYLQAGLYVGHSQSTTFVTDPTGTIELNGLKGQANTNAYESGVDLSPFDIVNEGLLEIQSGQNLLYTVYSGSQNPGGGGGSREESKISTLNLDNTGTVRVLQGAALGFEMAINDYAQGGATLAGGTWELVGANQPFANTDAVTDSNRSQVAAFYARVAKVSDADGNILSTFDGKIDGDFDGDGDADGDGLPDAAFDLDGFDTQLKTNAANIRLSGAASFAYLNTMSENAGSLTLQNQHTFHTQGDLVNSGSIRAESGARLSVHGQLTVDEGSLLATDGGSFAVYGEEGVHVLGGSVVYERDTPTALNINSKWVVQDKWLGTDEAGEDIVKPATVAYTNGYFPTIGTQADITLSGSQASFAGLQAVNVNRGRLAIQDGAIFVRNGDQDVFVNQGDLSVTNGGQLYVAKGSPFEQLTPEQARENLADFENTGTFLLDASSHMVVRSFNSFAGEATINGVLEAEDVFIDGELTGAGGIAGNVVINGTLSPGNSPGRMELGGDVFIEAGAGLKMEILGGQAGVSHDQLRVHGSLTSQVNPELLFDETMSLRSGQSWLLVDMLDPDQAPRFDYFDDPSQAPVTTGLAAAMDAHALAEGTLLLGSLDGRDIFLTTQGGTGNDLVAFAEGLSGDADDSGFLDAADIDAVAAGVRLAEQVEGVYVRNLDMDDDGELGSGDLDALIAGILGTAHGDADLDRDVDLDDLTILGTFYGQSGNWAQGDFDGDGTVGLDDLTILGTFYGFNGGAGSEMDFAQAMAAAGLGHVQVPEPASLLTLAMTGLLVDKRRRRA